MTNLPANGQYPIRFLTGISFAHSAEEQQRWQTLHDRNEAKLLASWASRKRVERAPSKAVSEFIGRNMFVAWIGTK